MNPRLDRLEDRMDGLDGRMDRLEGRMDGVESQVAGLESARHETNRRLGALEATSERINGRLEALEADVKELYTMIGQQSPLGALGKRYADLPPEQKVRTLYAEVLNLAKQFNIEL